MGSKLTYAGSGMRTRLLRRSLLAGIPLSLAAVACGGLPRAARPAAGSVLTGQPAQWLRCPYAASAAVPLRLYLSR